MKIDVQKEICESCDHAHFKEQISIFEAISYCRSWFPERQWLLKNNIDISGLQEEQDFMELAREHKLFEKARHIQVKQSMHKAENLSRRMSLKSEKMK